MLEKIITALEPFAIPLVIFAGASMANWVQFTNSYTVGVATVFAGVLLMVKHLLVQITNKG